jgi:hypothetical protein
VIAKKFQKKVLVDVNFEWISVKMGDTIDVFWMIGGHRARLV